MLITGDDINKSGVAVEPHVLLATHKQHCKNAINKTTLIAMVNKQGIQVIILMMSVLCSGFNWSTTCHRVGVTKSPSSNL